MKSTLRTAALLAAALGLTSGPAMAATTIDVPHQGAQFVRAGHPGQDRAAVKHEVVEFFWYGCHHSAELEKPLEDWAARHSGDVTLRRIPAVWPTGSDHRVQLAHARLYYTLERLGEVDRLQQAAFQAVREQHLDLTSEDPAAHWAADHGVDQDKFRTAYRSDEVRSAAAGASRLLADAKVTEIPTVLVDTGERTTPTTAGGVEQVPGALDKLVAQH